MARKVRQIIRCGTRIWSGRVYSGRDVETKKRMYTHAVLLSASKQAISGAVAGRRGLRPASLHFPEINASGVRKGVDEPLFGAIAGGHFGRGEGLFGMRGDLASGQVRRPDGLLPRPSEVF
jgi:hypothetical protein